MMHASSMLKLFLNTGIDVVLALNSSKIQRGNDKEKAHFVFSMLVDYLFRSSHMGHKSKESR
jgi:hypothetical protein